MKKRILSALVTLAMLVSIFPTTIFAATDWVTDEASLIAALEADLSARVKLSNDIELSSAWETFSATITESNPFTGTLNGKGKTISGLSIDTTEGYQGLFPYVGDGTTIEKLTVEGSVSGGNYVGGIVGYASGNVTITNCTFSGSVSGVNNVGGIVGGVSGSDTVNITNCTNAATITGGSYVGGIVGSVSTTTNITGCANAATVTGNGFVGGILGGNNGTDTITIESNTNTGVITGGYDVGEIVGDSSDVTLGTGSAANVANGSTLLIDSDGGYVFSADSPFTADGYGFTWTDADGDGSCETLTITADGLSITASGSGNGINVPDGTIIVLNGDLTINAQDDGIYCDGDLTIQGTGTLTINTTTSWADGIYCTGDLTIDGNAQLKINTEGDNAHGIHLTTGNLTIKDNANIEIDTAGADANGIDAEDGKITIRGNANIEIDTAGDDAHGIYAKKGNISIKSNAQIAITATGGSARGVYADDGMLTIEADAQLGITVASDSANALQGADGISIAGNARVNTNGEVYAGSDAITIAGDAVVEAAYITAEYDVNINDRANVTVLYYAYQTNDDAQYGVKVADTASFTGVASKALSSGCEDVVYGNFAIADTDQADNAFYAGTLAFAEGSSLTIADGAQVDWTEYDIDWANADITNNGMILLDGDDVAPSDIAALGITGTGSITLWDTDEDAALVTYTNDGTAATISGDIVLGDAQVLASDNKGYTWLEEDDTGVYTLTFDADTTVNGTIYVGWHIEGNVREQDTAVKAAILNLTNNVTVNGLISSYTDLTITGDKALTVQGEQSGIGTAEVSKEIPLVIDATVTASALVWFGEVIVTGNLTVGTMLAFDLTVSNGATVEITGGEMGGEMLTLALMGRNAEPTLNLDTNIAILTPTGGAYAIGDDVVFSAFDYVGAITTDGEVLAADFSNMAPSILIGAKPISSGSTEQTFTITCTAGTGGYFTCGNTATARIGEMAGFTIVCEDGYVISDVKVDGVSVGAVSYYVMTNILSDRTIEATFALAGSTASTAPTTGDDGSNAADDVTPDANTGTGSDDANDAADTNADGAADSADENNADADADVDSGLVESLATTSAINTIWMLGGMAAVLVLAGGAFFLFKRREIED